MRIPLGNFGFKTPDPPQGGTVGGAGSDAVASAQQGLAQVGMGLGQDLAAIAGAQQRQDRQQAQDMAKIKAATALTDRQLQIKSLHQDLEQRMQSGQLAADKAQAAYDSALSLLDTQVPDNLDPVTKAHYENGLKTIDVNGRLELGQLIDKGLHTQNKGAIDEFLDAQGKLAGTPGADIGAINAKADALDEHGVAAYGMNWARIKQNWKDSNWTNQASQRAMQAADNMAALNQLEHDLSRGYYVDKMDTDKRNAILRTVMADKGRLEAKAQHEADMREARAERVLGSIDQQIASGVPATADMWTNWANLTRGTAMEGEFRQRVQSEAEVQHVLRLPVDQQMGFIQRKQAELMDQGGSVRDQANLARLSNAVKTNLQQLQNEPLLYLQSRTGMPVAPLDMSQITNPAGAPALADTLQERAARIKATQQQYGASVQMNPLLPQERQLLSQALATASPRDQVQIMGNLYRGAGDADVYKGIMQQLAPDSPVKALAGMVMAKQRDMTLQHHWFSRDEMASSGDVATTMLQGEQILNKTRADKASDGQGKGIPLPPEKEFRQMFSDMAGAVFAGRPGAYEIAMQAMRAYYTGKAAQDGDVSGELDSRRMKQAVRATLGDVVDVNGNGQVLAPWGMDGDQFESRARAAFAQEAKRRGLPANVAHNYDALGLRNYGDGTYLVTQGRNYLIDDQHQPVVINLNDKP